MTEYLMRVLTSEAERAEQTLTAAKASFKEALDRPELVMAGKMEELAYTQAVVKEIMVFWIVAKKYQEDSELMLAKLKEKHLALKEELAEDDGPCSTSPWRNAEAYTIRKAKIAVMRKFVGLLD